MDPKHLVSLSGHASATGYPSNAVIGGAVSADDDARCVALALGGGGARGLAHLGVLQVLEAEEMRPTVLAGTSIGGLIAALYARSIPVAEIVSIARGFRFPRRFIPGRLLGWHEIFPTAVRVLAGLAFEDLAMPLAISAVDLQQGEEVVLHSGPLLPAVRATCAVPGVLTPERLAGRYLIDGGVMNVLPVDLAWPRAPDAVIAVNILGSPRQAVRLDTGYARLATRLGRILPNPITARLAFEIATRAVELALDRQRALAIAMTGPEALIDVNLRDVSLRDFDRLDEIVEAGRQATLVALPRLRTTFAAAPRASSRSTREFALNIDPVCRMVISPGRARATLERAGLTYYFCSANCRDSFERHAEHYLVDRPTRVSPRLCEEGDFSPGHWDSMIRGDRADLNLRSTRSERMRGEAEVGRGGLVGESAGPTCSHLETTRSECTIAPRQPDSQTAEAQSCRGAVSRVVAWSIIRLMA